MRNIVVFEHLTLDGVMQSPGRPDEDSRGGFPHGGWATTRMRPDQDPVLGQAIGESMSKTGGILLGRNNSTLLQGNLADAVTRLKKTAEKDIVVLGSGKLVRSLVKADLVDEFWFLIHPLVMGSGRRLFSDDRPPVSLKLEDVKASATGVMVARYRPARSKPN